MSATPTQRLEPKSSLDLTGWTQITCHQSEVLSQLDMSVVSSHTDIDKPDVFTEWWLTEGTRVIRPVPVLRDYRDQKGCRHYLAGKPDEAGLVITDAPEDDVEAGAPVTGSVS